MKRLGFFLVLLLAGACSSNSVEGNSGQDTAIEGELTTAVIRLGSDDPSQITPIPEPDTALEVLLADLPNATSSGTFEHTCGTFAFVDSGGRSELLEWKEDSWIKVPLDSVSLSGSPDQVVDNLDIEDVTADGSPEIVVRWITPDAMRPFGVVLWSSKPSCTWSLGTLVDSCGPSNVVDGLSADGENLVASGFPAACAGRETVFYDWKNEFGLWLSNTALTYGRNCPPLVEYNELPFSICTESYFIRIAQAELSSRGFVVEVDGQFGPGTQYAILEFQSRESLELTGLLDSTTWNRLNPAQGLGYIDYDGDGVVTPTEINHASGFD